MSLIKRVAPIFYSLPILMGFSLIAYVLLNGKGFFSDDWAVISFPYFYRLPQAFTENIIVLRRPIQAVYHGLAIKATGFDADLLFLLSMGLLAVGCVFMGLATLVMFPVRPTLAAFTVLFGFFMPSALSITYWLNADNMRIATICYWLSVLLFQHWALKPQWGSLPLLPTLFFTFALMSYESVAAMPVVTALYVLPIYWRTHSGKSWMHHGLALAHLVAAHIASYMIFAYIRSVYNITSHVRLTADWLSLWSQYPLGMAAWFIDSLTFMARYPDLLAWGAAIGISVLGVGLWGWQSQRQTLEDNLSAQLPLNMPMSVYGIVLGGVIFLMGTLPFALYNQTFDTQNSIGAKVFTLAAFGLALWLALGMEFLWRKAGARAISLVLLGLWVSVWGAHHIQQRGAYTNAEQSRHALHQSLHEVVPQLMPQTLLIYIDYNLNDPTYSDYVIVQSENSADYQTKLFYNTFQVSGIALNDYSTGFDPVVYADRLQLARGDVPLDALVIVRREGTQYVLVDELTRADAAGYNLLWEGDVQSIRTNEARILPRPTDELYNRFHRIIGLDAPPITHGKPRVLPVRWRPM